MKRRWLLPAIILAVGLVAAACQGAATPTSAPVGNSGGVNIPGGSFTSAPGSGMTASTPGEATRPYYLMASNGQQTGIWVSGEGRVSLVPDVAILRLGIEAQATTVAEANRQEAEAMDRVMAALRQGGVADRDIQTTSFSITPITRWVEDRLKGGGYQETIGYRVSNQVSVKVREVDEAGVIIDAVATAGGDLTRIQSISFTADDPAAAIIQAREAALKDTMAKAQQMATVTGVTLGKPVYITETSATPPPVQRATFGEMPAPLPTSTTSISPGEQEIRVSVQMVFAIQ